MTKPSMKSPEPWGDGVVSTGQFGDRSITFITRLDGLRRCDWMKFADSTAASIYVLLDVASASRADRLSHDQPSVFIAHITENLRSSHKKKAACTELTDESNTTETETNPEDILAMFVSLGSLL